MQLTASRLRPDTHPHCYARAQLETFWQSDGGAQPHTITVQFHRRTEVSAVALYLLHTLDESYTPQHIVIKAGTTFHDLHTVRRGRGTGWGGALCALASAEISGNAGP